MNRLCKTCGSEDCRLHSDFLPGQQVRVQCGKRVEVGTILRVNPTTFTLRTVEGRDIRVRFPWFALRHGIPLDVQITSQPSSASTVVGGAG